VEVWFSILSGHALAGASLTSPRQVRDQIDAFIGRIQSGRYTLRLDQAGRFSQTPAVYIR